MDLFDFHQEFPSPKNIHDVHVIPDIGKGSFSVSKKNHFLFKTIKYILNDIRLLSQIWARRLFTNKKTRANF